MRKQDVAEKGFYDRKSGLYHTHVPKSTDKYTDHIKQIARDWRAGFKEFGLPFKVKSVRQMTQRKEVLKYRHRLRFLKGEERGVWHINQILTACAVIARQLACPGMNICIQGSTQVGKTGTLLACLVGGILRYFSTGQLTTNLYLSPAKKSLEEQSLEEYEIGLELYGDMEFTDGGDEEISLSTFLNAYAPLKNYDTCLPSKRAGRSRKTTSAKQIANFHRQGREKLEAGHHVQICMDEVHHGHHNIKGVPVAARFLRPFINDIISNPNLSLLASSATPYCAERIFDHVDHKLTDSYHGHNFHLGVKRDPSVKTTAPQIISFRQAEEMSGMAVSCFSRTALDNRHEMGFEREQERREKDGCPLPGDNWEEYKEFFLEEFGRLVNWCLIDENPLDAQGMAVRLLNNNRKMADFLDEFKCDTGVEIIRYWKPLSDISVKDTLEQLDYPERYLLVMTGAGRMADSIPRECGYFFDLTNQMTTHTSQEQGFFGRATGYDKNSMVIVADKVAASQALFCEDNGRLHKLAIQGAVQEKGGGMMKERTALGIRRDMPGPVIQEVFRRLDLSCAGLKAKLNVPITDHNKTGMRAPKPRNGFPDFWDIFDEELLKYLEDGNLEKHLNLRFPYGFGLLRPGEETIEEQGEKSKTYHDKKVGLRLMGAQKSDVAQTREHYKSERTQPGGQTKFSPSGAVYHQPQVHCKVDRRNGRLKPQRVGLLLQAPTCPYSKPIDQVTVGPTSWLWDLLTKDQKKAAKKMMPQNQRESIQRLEDTRNEL